MTSFSFADTDIVRTGFPGIALAFVGLLVFGNHFESSVAKQTGAMALSVSQNAATSSGFAETGVRECESASGAVQNTV